MTDTFTHTELPMTFDYWLSLGIKHGFCGPVVCSTHDGTPLSVEEEEEFEDGYDPCVHVIRAYNDEDHRQSVEANHAPTIWRNTEQLPRVPEQG
jgi:hypothetical protein